MDKILLSPGNFDLCGSSRALLLLSGHHCPEGTAAGLCSSPDELFSSLPHREYTALRPTITAAKYHRCPWRLPSERDYPLTDISPTYLAYLIIKQVVFLISYSVLLSIQVHLGRGGEREETKEINTMQIYLSVPTQGHNRQTSLLSRHLRT